MATTSHTRGDRRRHSSPGGGPAVPCRVAISASASRRSGRPGYLNLGHGDDLGADRSVDALRARAYDGPRRRLRGRRALLRRGALLRARARSSSARGCARARPTTWSSARSGATSTPPAGRSTPTRPRSSTTTSSTLRRQLERDARAARRPARALPDPLGDAGQRRARDDAVLEELAALRASGVRDRPERRAARAGARRSTARVELGLFDAVQATWNLHERAAGAGARRARTRRGCSVIVKEALANGRLADRGAAPELVAAAARLGATPDARRARRRARAAVRRRRAQRRGDDESAARPTSPRRSSARTRRSPTLAAARGGPGEYWERRSALPWN